MRQFLTIGAASLLAAGLGSLAAQTARTAPPPSSPRERLSINDGWRFTKGDPFGTGVDLLYDVRPAVNEDRDERPAGAERRPPARIAANVPTLKPWVLPTGNAFIKDPAKRHLRPAGNPGGDVPYVREDFDDRSWRRVDLPHDWGIEGPFLETGPHGGMGRLPSWGIGWYRKTLHLAPGDAGRSIFLDVDGAMSYATVWLNGQIAGGWPYGYSSWRVDLTPYIRHGGANPLAIRVDNPPGSSRWYPGGGIYRNVWLTRTHALHVSRWGTFVRTP